MTSLSLRIFFFAGQATCCSLICLTLLAQWASSFSLKWQVGELEAGLIGERTKAALAAAKQRGVRLGSYGAETLAPKYQAEAKARADLLAPLIRDFQKRGYSMRGIAAELQKRKAQTLRGGSWHPQLVKRIVERIDVGT